MRHYGRKVKMHAAEKQITHAAWQPRIVAILCNWCSYAGADLAGVSRLQYPPTIRIVRVMCSGRMNPSLVVRALQDGADGVLVAGCHPGDCHYLKGNLYARRRYAVLSTLLDLLGLERDRFRMNWISASEGGRFAEVVSELTESVRKLGPQRQLRRI
jgi:coenzyme F420-reducing hydrogenase delta subunit